MPTQARKTAAKAAPKSAPIAAAAADLSDELAAVWGTDAEVIEGFEIVPKESLVKTPFLITQAKWRTNARDVMIVDIDAIDGAGRPFQFNDSSSGVKAQLEAYLHAKGMTDAVEREDAVPLRLAVPGGLRGSTFATRDKVTGKMVQATTYYLTLQAPKA